MNGIARIKVAKISNLSEIIGAHEPEVTGPIGFGCDCSDSSLSAARWTVQLVLILFDPSHTASVVVNRVGGRYSINVSHPCVPLAGSSCPVEIHSNAAFAFHHADWFF